MTLLYACQLACIALVPLSLVFNQGLLIPPLLIIAYLIRQQSILEQQLTYLLNKDSLRDTARRLHDTSVPQPPRVKGL